MRMHMCTIDFMCICMHMRMHTHIYIYTRKYGYVFVFYTCTHCIVRLNHMIRSGYSSRTFEISSVPMHMIRSGYSSCTFGNPASNRNPLPPCAHHPRHCQWAMLCYYNRRTYAYLHHWSSQWAMHLPTHQQPLQGELAHQPLVAAKSHRFQVNANREKTDRA